MPEQFKLVKEKFSEADQEWQGSYELKIIFNGQSINFITITDHPWQKKGREMITKELILNIFQHRLNNQEMKPKQKVASRNIYIWEGVPYQGRTYHFTFWFKDNTDNHLGVRNCYPIS